MTSRHKMAATRTVSQSKKLKTVLDRFELLYSGDTPGAIQIKKWRSCTSGMTMYLAQVPGPLVNGYFSLATEADSNDGLPHTLEHLVFMGSFNYPFKGVLDRLANRSLASGTNAWTSTDHTCYTSTNAGADGFLNLLPIYLDHILYPTLLDSAYMTEVHHINGEGEDAGVVYAEMHSSENTCEDKMKRALQENMYPGECGYRYETGGLIGNIRTSTSNLKVRDYHKQYYIPSNLHIIITGQVEEERVLSTIAVYEDSIHDKMADVKLERPWQSPVPSLSGDSTITVTYPSDDEDHGNVLVAWRTPYANDFYAFNCLNILMDYLTVTANSPLEKSFVDKHAICSRVCYDWEENSEGYVSIEFENVSLDKLDSIHKTLMDLLNKIVTKRKIDLTRILRLIKNKTRDELNDLETDPHDTMSKMFIADSLFGTTTDHIRQRSNQSEFREKMLLENKEFWLNFLSKWLLNKPSVTIVGRPSQRLMVENGKEEKDRVEKQKKDLGEDGLREKGVRLEKAISQIQKPPASILASVPLPSVDSIQYHGLHVYTNEEDIPKNHPKFSVGDIQYKFQLDDIHTNFVKITAVLDSSDLTEFQRHYLPLLTECLFELPIKREGADQSGSDTTLSSTLSSMSNENQCQSLFCYWLPAFSRHSKSDTVSYTDVIDELESTALSYGATVGFGGETFSGGYYPHVVMVYLKIERENYELGIRMLRELLFSTKFDVDRLRVWVDKLLKEISTLKRDENAILGALVNSLHYTSECNLSLVTIYKQKAFLEKLKKSLKSQPNKVVADIEEIRSILLKESNLRIHMYADVDKLVATNTGLKPEKEWINFLPLNTHFKPSSIVNKKQTHSYMRPLHDLPAHHLIIGVGGVESMHLHQATNCINCFSHEDLPALTVLTQYLRKTEGPLWEGIRGQGLAYGFDLSVNPETGLLSLYLSDSPNVVKAYSVAHKIVTDYVEGVIPFDKLELESAISSLIFEYISEVGTVADVSFEALLSYYRMIDHDHIQKLIPKIAAVKLEQLPLVAQKYLKPLFDVSQVRSAIVCSPSQVKETIKAFNVLNIPYKATTEAELSR